MVEAPVTETIRALLARGLTSGEIIAKGFRPGTVYRVQRSLRLAAALAPEPRSAHGEDDGEETAEQHEEPEDWPEDESSAEDRIAQLESGLGDISRELSELRGSNEGRFSSATSQFSQVGLELSRLNRRVSELEKEVRWLREAAEDAIALLASQILDPAKAWEWLGPPSRALKRVRGRLVEIYPWIAEVFLGDRIEDFLSGTAPIEIQTNRRKDGRRPASRGS